MTCCILHTSCSPCTELCVHCMLDVALLYTVPLPCCILYRYHAAYCTTMMQHAVPLLPCCMLYHYHPAYRTTTMCTVPLPCCILYPYHAAYCTATMLHAVPLPCCIPYHCDAAYRTTTKAVVAAESDDEMDEELLDEEYQRTVEDLDSERQRLRLRSQQVRRYTCLYTCL